MKRIELKDGRANRQFGPLSGVYNAVLRPLFENIDRAPFREFVSSQPIQSPREGISLYTRRMCLFQVLSHKQTFQGQGLSCVKVDLYPQEQRFIKMPSGDLKPIKTSANNNVGPKRTYVLGEDLSEEVIKKVMNIAKAPYSTLEDLYAAIPADNRCKNEMLMMESAVHTCLTGRSRWADVPLVSRSANPDVRPS